MSSYILLCIPLLCAILFFVWQYKCKRVSNLYILLFILCESILSQLIFISEQGKLLLTLISILLFILCGMNTVYIRKRHEERFIEYQEKVLKQQVEEVNEIYLTMRGWRHDYHNHMQKMKAHIALNQMEEMKAYLDQLEVELDNIDVTYRTGNVSIDAILNSKLSIAQKADIDINCKVELTDHLSVTDIDLCVLIGNLIDNAVEACEKLKPGEPRFLRIYICIRKQQLYIAITNATNEVIRKLDRDYVTNKRGNHGHGLRRIDAIVHKYQGYIRRANEPGVFSTEIMLPLM